MCFTFFINPLHQCNISQHHGIHMIDNSLLNESLKRIEKEVYKKCSFEITKYKNETESEEYDACRYLLNELKIIYRKGKITPKKVGQFVTFWKRNHEGKTMPFHELDDFDFYIITVKTEDRIGQFVFSKSILADKGIISTSIKDGKRGFRVYPPWDLTTNKQAKKSQKWQLDHFFEIDEDLDLKTISRLYHPE